MSSREIMSGAKAYETETFTFRDPVVKNVCEEFVRRSDVGFEKYGQTLDDERRSKVKNLADYLRDVQEELMDAILYIQTAREELNDLEAAAEKRMNIIGQNGNEGLHYDGAQI